MMQKREKLIVMGLLLAGSLPVWWMISALLCGALLSIDELIQWAGGVFTGAENMARWSLFPQYPTMENIKTLLLDTPGFYVTFWNSYKQVGGILLLQGVLGIPAAWALARYSFVGRRICQLVYIVLMLLPFQVLMLSEYMVLSKLQLMNTDLAVILPAGFSTMSVVILSRFFATIPDEMLEAARIDGAGEITILCRMGIPVCKGGIFATLLLVFLEQINAVERPMNFLKDKTLWPLSIYLPLMTEEKLSIAFMASLVSMLPCILIFFTAQDNLEQGIAATGLKG